MIRWLAVNFIVLSSACVMAGAGDVTLRTDHPQYPGEGAFQTVEQCVAFATAGKTQSQDRAIAMYNWFLTHQWHLMSPMEWCVPGRTPDSADAGDYETVVFDANRARFSYGYGLCGTVHAWNEPYWKALGFPARRREFPNHVNSEIFYDGAWHAYDTDMAGLLFRPDGVVAGYADIQNSPSLAKSVKAPVPHYPFAWPSDFDSMKNGWEEVARRKEWYCLYNGGYEAHPSIVQLRSGETFTRWYDRDHYGGPSQRRFWQHQKDGPFRQWTYFNNGTPFHDAEKANARSDASYCNGEFVYEPDLQSNRYREGTIDLSANIANRATSPRLYSSDGKKATITFRHFSPYVICGDPVDDANPMSAPATDGFVVAGTAVGDVACEVSADEGQTWIVESVSATADGTFRMDLTERVKGRYGWQLRFAFSDKSGLDRLKFVTTTQVCQSMYPRLTENGCDVEIQSKPLGVVAVLPNFAIPEDRVTAFEEVSFRSANLRYQPRSRQSRFAYQATDKKPAHVVFKVDAPDELSEVRAAVRYQISVPPPEGCDFQLQVSTDNGSSWQTFATADVAADNEFSSGWLAGKADVAASQSRSALVRFTMYTPGRNAALIDAQLYGVHKVAPANALSLEFGWFEGNEAKAHSVQIEPNASVTTLRVPTGVNVKDSFVRIQSIE